MFGFCGILRAWPCRKLLHEKNNELQMERSSLFIKWLDFCIMSTTICILQFDSPLPLLPLGQNSLIKKLHVWHDRFEIMILICLWIGNSYSRLLSVTVLVNAEIIRSSPPVYQKIFFLGLNNPSLPFDDAFLHGTLLLLVTVLLLWILIQYVCYK